MSCLASQRSIFGLEKSGKVSPASPGDLRSILITMVETIINVTFWLLIIGIKNAKEHNHLKGYGEIKKSIIMKQRRQLLRREETGS